MTRAPVRCSDSDLCCLIESYRSIGQHSATSRNVLAALIELRAARAAIESLDHKPSRAFLLARLEETK